MNHKPNCKFKDFRESLTARDPNGPDTVLTIDETGITYDENEFTIDPAKDYFLPFAFCPCCGEKLID